MLELAAGAVVLSAEALWEYEGVTQELCHRALRVRMLRLDYHSQHVHRIDAEAFVPLKAWAKPKHPDIILRVQLPYYLKHSSPEEVHQEGFCWREARLFSGIVCFLLYWFLGSYYITVKPKEYVTFFPGVTQQPIGGVYAFHMPG